MGTVEEKKTRNTKHQQAVLDLLQRAKKTLTADEIKEQIEANINKTTVYRMLDRFIDAGKIHFVTGQNGKSYYALCKDCKEEPVQHIHNHLHFQCENCGNVECLPETLDVPRLKDYKIKETQLLLIGICKTCVTKNT
ncbi:Fur family transcriptional regulator [Zunongwangia endophytica]|uniref:Fur family transcriptional regulator n=1 Tax=Zunongwangia endophytica TaxID=1808945 RepID=A0ABV8HEH3_9FLAO|nr:transcriptional repressor [Zunongwangia endophytica]MDN3596899.1 transcriptional repressor [Zunongwangia endophytica]